MTGNRHVPVNRSGSDTGSKGVTVAMVVMIMTVVTQMEMVFIMGTDDGRDRMIIAFIPVEMLPPRLMYLGPWFQQMEPFGWFWTL